MNGTVADSKHGTFCLGLENEADTKGENMGGSVRSWREGDGLRGENAMETERRRETGTQGGREAGQAGRDGGRGERGVEGYRDR